MNLKQAYAYCVQFLERNQVEEAEFKALCLVCHVAGIRNSEYLSHTQDFVEPSRLAKLLWRVKSGEPLQYVLGKWDFYESEFYVGEGVLIPRPETEELVALAVRCAEECQARVIYDLCSGSGCIGISLAQKTNATVYCVEKSEQAFFYLQKNAQGKKNVITVLADIAAPLRLPQADMIVSNPPYIPSSEIDVLQAEVQQEPRMALDGGADGLDFYRIINDNMYHSLKKDGKLLLEIGENQGDDIQGVLTHFHHIHVLQDMYGKDRMVIADKK